MFDQADFERAARDLDVPIAHIKAIVDVESAGETFWTIDGKSVVPVRFEAHIFGKRTGYRFNDSHPELSCVDWNPELAARTRAGAWDQVNRARELDRNAADESSSWGAAQIMGFHWQLLRYNSVQSFVDSMSDRGDDGQMDAFTKFIKADHALHASLALGAWLDVEKRFNGGGHNGAYAVKLAAAAARYGAPGAARAQPRTLRLGDAGDDVKALQEALALDADGIFGPDTDAAVRTFQRIHDLVDDGIVGRMTRTVLGF